MKDKDGTFLVTSPTVDQRKSKSPTFNQESSSEEEEELDLTPQLTQLHYVLRNLEGEKMAVLVELESTKGEVNRLKAELNSAKDRIVELWQENCEQLLWYPSTERAGATTIDEDSRIERIGISQTESIFFDRGNHSRF